MYNKYYKQSYHNWNSFLYFYDIIINCCTMNTVAHGKLSRDKFTAINCPLSIVVSFFINIYV